MIHMKCQVLFLKTIEKNKIRTSSAAVVIGALRVNKSCTIWENNEAKDQLFHYDIPFMYLP